MSLKHVVAEILNGEPIEMVFLGGQKRQIHRMYNIFGLGVTGPKRVRIGPLCPGALPEGEWRYVNPELLLHPLDAIAARSAPDHP